MTDREYKKLELGDLVAPIRGVNKDKPAKVIMISDITCNGYREALVFAKYINPEDIVHNNSYAGWADQFNMSYKTVKKL
jgi:hypothetical protein